MGAPIATNLSRAIVFLALALANGVPFAAEPEFLTAPGAEKLDLPFSEAVRLGDTLHLSGQIGTLPGTTQLVGGGIGPQTQQTMTNIRSVLERHGSSMARVVKCTVFLADIDEWPAMNGVYITFFDGPLPARSAFAATGLALGARVEIECLAAAGVD